MNTTTCESLGVAVSYPDSFTQTYKTIHVAAAVIAIPLSVFTVAANGTIIISLLLSHFKNPRDGFAVNVSIVKSLIISMAVSDAMIGCFSMPLAIYQLLMYGHWALGQSLCALRQASDVFMCTVSIYHVTCMAVDRYLAVCWPLTYRTLTINTGYSMIGLSWGIPAALSLVPFLTVWHVQGLQDVVACFRLSRHCGIVFNLPYQTTAAIISFYTPMMAICVFYYLIARRVWLVSRTFSSTAFRNSIWRLRRNVYSLPSRSREREAPLSSLREGNGKLLLKEVDSQENNTMTQVMCTPSQVMCTPSQVMCTPSQVMCTPSQVMCTPSQVMCTPSQVMCTPPQVMCTPSQVMCTPSQVMCTSPQHATANKTTVAEHCGQAQGNLRQQTEQQCPRTVAHALLTSHNSHSINNSSAYPKIPDEGNSATSHHENTKARETIHNNYTGNELTLDISANCQSIIHSSNKNTPRLRIFHEQITSSGQQHNHRTRKTSRERNKGVCGNMRTVRTIGSVVVCFTLCWMPFSVYIVVESYYNYTLPLWPCVMLIWLGYLNSALNPVLYCGNRSIRQAVHSFICRQNAQTVRLSEI